MAKRFTDSEIWKNQRWFRKLSPIYKLVFCYLKDMCNHAGIWKIDCSDLIEDLGIESFELDDFIKKCNIDFDPISGKPYFKERLRVVNSSILITGFIQFQYQGRDGKVNPDAAPVKTALQMLEGLDNSSITLTEVLHKGYITLTKEIGNPPIRPKDKDKDKDIIKIGVENFSKNGDHEKHRVEGFKRNLLSDQYAIETTCITTKIDDVKFLQGLEIFITTKISSKESLEWKTEKDFRRNFIYWIPSWLEREKKEIRKNGISPKRNKDLDP